MQEEEKLRLNIPVLDWIVIQRLTPRKMSALIADSELHAANTSKLLGEPLERGSCRSASSVLIIFFKSNVQ